MTCLQGLPIVATLLLSTTAFGEVVVLNPSNAFTFSAGDTNAIALQFDVGALKAEDNIQVDEATLEWALPEIETGGRFEFHLRENDLTLPAEQGAGVLAIPAIVAGEDVWEFEEADFEKIGKGMVRLDLTRIARGWINQGRVNRGVVVYSPDMELGTLRSRAQEARLIVRYSEHP